MFELQQNLFWASSYQLQCCFGYGAVIEICTLIKVSFKRNASSSDQVSIYINLCIINATILLVCQENTSRLHLYIYIEHAKCKENKSRTSKKINIQINS